MSYKFTAGTFETNSFVIPLRSVKAVTIGFNSFGILCLFADFLWCIAGWNTGWWWSLLLSFGVGLIIFYLLPTRVLRIKIESKEFAIHGWEHYVVRLKMEISEALSQSHQASPSYYINQTGTFAVGFSKTITNQRDHKKKE